ncbi:unnamed protein product [Miscanthus lutarioriparius]|uniref:Uncharacterized protein n=1 Tax=Miscanthus lutarioriparius TaxID=422564 RepID=A0A811S3Y2_9POAL|nr:unnamed protein product [Miscanthus lutarioriparius]
MEMEKMMGWQIPAFGMWNYCNNDLSITQYFDSAMQARLMKRCWNRRGSAAVVVGEKAGVACGEQQLVLFRTPSFQRKPAAQIKVIRREVEEHCDGNELQDGGGVQADEVVAYPMKRKVIISKAVDEDLYKVPQPQPPMYQKPRKMRKVVWSMWIGCLGLDCIA